MSTAVDSARQLLLDWGTALAEVGVHRWQDSPQLAWPDEVDRFCRAIARLDCVVKDSLELAVPE